MADLMSERYFDPSVAGLTSDQKQGSNMNNAPKKDDDKDDLPVLADSDVELIGGPKLPEMTEADIENALSEGSMKAEGAIEQSKAEKAGEILSRMGNEIVGLDMRSVFEKGGDIKPSLELLKKKFLEQGSSIDPGKTPDELLAVLHEQVADLKRTYDADAAKGDATAKRIAGDIDSFRRTLEAKEAGQDVLGKIRQELLADLKAGKYKDSKEAATALQAALEANVSELRSSVDATELSGAGSMTGLLELINEHFADDSNLTAAEKEERKQELFGGDADIDIDDVFKVA